jgi:thiamine pyrophosphokinase
LTEKSTGVSELGLKYQLQNAELTSTWPLGVSNSFTGKKAEIEVKSGILLVIYPAN